VLGGQVKNGGNGPQRKRVKRVNRPEEVENQNHFVLLTDPMARVFGNPLVNKEIPTFFCF